MYGLNRYGEGVLFVCLLKLYFAVVVIVRVFVWVW